MPGPITEFSLQSPFRSPMRSSVSLDTTETPVKRNPSKRKCTPSIHTPLSVARGDASFDRLAPLPAPRFGAQDIVEPEQLQEETLMLSLSTSDDEVVEAVSPGGHINKRRARSRPVSLELLESVKDNVIAFPFPASPPLAATELVSPMPRRRLSGNITSPKRRISKGKPSLSNLRVPHTVEPGSRRAPLARVDSATLFFGPENTAPSPRRDLAVNTTRANAAFAKGGKNLFGPTTRPTMVTRHSYTGTYSGNASLKSLELRSTTPSPRSSPMTLPTVSPWDHRSDDEDAFFGDSSFGTPMPKKPSSASLPYDSPFEDSPFNSNTRFTLNEPSFQFNITAGTPRKATSLEPLPLKFKPRDSGVVLTDEEKESAFLRSPLLRASASLPFSPSPSGTLSLIIPSSNSLLPPASSNPSMMPSASTSVSTIYSSEAEDAGLITPGFTPSHASAWPRVAGTDDTHDTDGNSDEDAFIMKTLAAGAKGPQPDKKKAPGTPVKKTKLVHYEGGSRPWQSAVAMKISDLDFDLVPAGGAEAQNGKGLKVKKVPRKSLPAAFPALKSKKSKNAFVDTDSDDDQPTGGLDDSSPSSRKTKYEGLGLGRPKLLGKKDGIPALPWNAGTSKDTKTSGVSRTRWLMRRSSSGQFSSGSEVSTPTRTKTKDWQLPTPDHGADRLKVSPIRNSLLMSGRSTSTSSTSTVNSPLNSPTTSRLLPSKPAARSTLATAPTAKPPGNASHEAVPKELGRFERDFVMVEEAGSGEFGKVMKVKYKDGRPGMFAVKRSKQYEGVRHRLRLREEVDILQHLSVAASAGLSGAQGRHPNVLAYIDTWEQDDELYIRTELCELGNFARFLWDFGRAFPKLDEAKVWKIMVDLSNGLRFIHDSDVIHMDFKPENIFVTSDGRFKIGDFGMASLWPRPEDSPKGEREGDKLYLAPEVLQGRYSKAADVFSFGMTMLETASNIIVPDQGEPWQRLRQENFGQIDLSDSPELLQIIKGMMRTDPAMRVDMSTIWAHPIVTRARDEMESIYLAASKQGTSVFAASPLASVDASFLDQILAREFAMDLSP